jgi:hypothetical protein
MRSHSVGCGTASQTLLGFQSALIVQRLRGQGYGDSPDAVFHSFSTAHIHNRLSDTIECSQPLPKNFNPKFSTLSIQKHYPTPEWCAGCSQPMVGVMTTSQHVYEVRRRKDHRGVDLISDALPFGRLWRTRQNRFWIAGWQTIRPQSAKKAQMKTILILIVGLMLAGCGSTGNHVRNRDAVDRNRYLVEHNAVDTICACP